MKCKALLAICLAGVALLCGCGGSSSSSSNATTAPLTSNWQWTMDDPLQQGGLTGGFFQQKGNSVTGSLAYAIYAGPSHLVCAGGSAPVTGTVNGQMVTLTAIAAGQTYTFTGTLATTATGSTMTGKYTSTDGAAFSGGGTCGAGQQSLNWSAIAVSPLTGAFQGTFHSASNGSFAGRDFPVTGTLTQGENAGADFATVTGTLSASGYPCLSQASLNGTISGSSVILSIIGNDGLAVGEIGSPSVSGLPPTPAVLQVGGTGPILLSALNNNRVPPGGYQVTTGSCPALNGGLNPGDSGNACLGLGTSTDCGMPISFSPPTLTFPAQVLGSSPTTQTITITNTDPLNQPQNLTLSLGPVGLATNLLGDFNAQPNYTEQDNCGPSPFTLASNQSCTVFVSFSPQESCPWYPLTVPSLQCPSTPGAQLEVKTASNPLDGDSGFNVPISGTGLSALVPSTAELDFGPEDPSAGEQTDPQWITFTNQAPYPVEILPSAPCAFGPLPIPLVPGVASGLQVVSVTSLGAPPGGGCDAPPPNSEFPFNVDNCSGITLQPQQVCTVSIAYKPQVGTALQPSGTFLELNTLQCVFPLRPSSTNPCEIDGGRFPVTLTTQTDANPIRLIPAASLTFAAQAVGSTSASQSITVFNDPNDHFNNATNNPNAAALVFQSIVLNGTDYAETSTCGSSLAIGQSCTITVTFTPTHTGLRQGTVVMTFPSEGGATIFLRGTGK